MSPVPNTLWRVCTVETPLENQGTSHYTLSLAPTHTEEDEVLRAHAPTQTRPYAWLPLI